MWKTKTINDAVVRISCVCGEYVYLVKGRERAALLDTGVGIGDLASFVRTLSDLPVIVLNTHGHRDHAGGDFAFETVYLHEKDQDLMREWCTVEKRKQYYGAAAANGKALRAALDGDFVPERPMDFNPLREGDAIDLGGRELIVAELPGHTAGSVVFIDPSERTAYMGDACNATTYAFLKESASLSAYRTALIRFRERHFADFDRMAHFHAACDAPKSCLDEVIRGCDAVLGGETEGYETPIRITRTDCRPRSAFAMNAGGERLDGGRGNVLFDPDKLY